MSKWTWAAIALLLFMPPTRAAVRTQATAEPVHAREPGADLTLQGRTLSSSLNGQQAEVRIELVLNTMVDLRATRLQGVDAAGRPLPDPGFFGEEGPQSSGQVRRLQWTIELPAGKDATLTFTMDAEDLAGRALKASASVNVVLDPAHQPAIVGDLIQYRAEPLGR